MLSANARYWSLFIRFLGACLAFNSIATGESGVDSYKVSCYNARNIHANTAEFCWMVDWVAATLYNATNFSVYTAGGPISVTDQDSVARSLAGELVDMSSGGVTAECKHAVRRFACVSTFPYCPQVGLSFSSASYMPPCKMQCEQVQQACTTSLYAHVPHPVSLDCSEYKSNHNCMLKVPADRFLLNPEQGPYDGTAALYIAMLIVWALLGAMWAYLVHVVYPGTALFVSKALGAVPMLRVVTAAISTIFWLDCAENGGMCQNLRAAALLLFLPFVEAVQMFMFLALARGWGTTRAYLPQDTWRLHLCLSFSFYVCLTVFSSTLPPASVTWIIFSAATYGTMYAVILRSAFQEMAVLDGQGRCLTERMSALAAEPLREKCDLFRRFLTLVFCELLLEASCRYLYAAQSTPFLVLLLLYELCSTLFLVLIGVQFRPRQYSPFFFMMPTSLEYGAVPTEEVEQEEVAEEPRRTEEGASGWWGLRGVGAMTNRGSSRRGLTSREHSREREDDVAAIERIRLSRTQRPSPFVEVFLHREHPAASLLHQYSYCGAEDGGDAMHTQGVESKIGNTQQLQQQQHQYQQAAGAQQGIELVGKGRATENTLGLRPAPDSVSVSGPGPGQMLGISSASPSSSTAATSVDALVLPESLDLSRLLASVGSALHPSSGGSIGDANSHSGHSGRHGPGTVAPEGVVVAVDGLGNRLSAETVSGPGRGLQLRDLGLGGDHAASSFSSGASHGAPSSQPPPLAPAPLLLAPWSDWLQPHTRAPAAVPTTGSRSRIIAVTGPDRQEVMLAISKPDP